MVNSISDVLLSRRFHAVSSSNKGQRRYVLSILQSSSSSNIELSLRYSTGRGRVALVEIPTDASEEEQVNKINSFIDDVFSHQIDPQSEPLPALPLLDKIF